MAKKTNAFEKNMAYTHLLIFPRLRFGLWGLILLFLAVFSGLLFHHAGSTGPWFIIVPSIILPGLILAIYPATEDWTYHPWQVQPQQYERHFID